ncbi:MAG TPA: branched-chain amino acid ABC transporter permease [Candidatus Atribacteria bacterium]|nr:MAG: branched-chain amino acid ABC transporter permease [Candidatus Nealsonbacteria bacterium]HDK28012.1 branched-chain amino acid ABC transporter permease [Candidatus Atribacteria bacterium]
MDMNVNLVLALFFNGIVLGLIYAVVAVGFSLVLGVAQVINFSHGILFAFGAYFFWSISNTAGFWIALFLSPILVAIMGLLIELLLVRRVYGQDPLFGLLITFGFALAMEEVIRMIWGKVARSVSTPFFAQGQLIMGDIIYSKYRIILAIFSLLILLLVWWVITRTSFGAIIKAGMFDSEMISALGHNLPLLRTGIFVIGAFLAGLAGVIAAPLWSIKSGMGTDILMPAFIIALIGGLGSIKGTIIAGLLVGTVTSLAVLFIPRFTDILPYLMLIVVLFYKPKGLFGEVTILGEVREE